VSIAGRRASGRVRGVSGVGGDESATVGSESATVVNGESIIV
jgi:hypothetical protein